MNRPSPECRDTPAPVLSVVIPVHDAADTLVDQLDGIARAMDAGPPAEILVVDNRSTDGSSDVARRWSDSTGVPVRIVAAEDRAGEPHARNVGLAAARAPWVCYCDADDIVAPTWLAAMAAGLAEASYVTGPIDTHELNEAWIASVRGTSVTTGRSTLHDVVPYAHGCNMGFRRQLLEQLGGFDERYLAGCDLDIAVRCWEAGHDLRFEDGAAVAYRLRADLGATWRQGVTYGRFRIPIRRRLESAGIDVGDLRRIRRRRMAWLARKALPSLWSRSTRARWVWVAAQLRGERQGERRDPTA